MNPLDSGTFSPPDAIDEEPLFSMVDALAWLGEGKRLIAAVTAAAAVAATAAALLMPNIYTARATLLPPNSQQQSNSSAALAALGSLGGLTSGLTSKTPDELYMQLLRSDSVQRALAEKFKLYERYDIHAYDVLRKTLPKYIRVSSDKKSSVITIEVDDKVPQFAADLANAHAAEVTKLLGRLAVSEAQQRRVFFEQQLKEAKENLIQSEQALRSVQEKSGMVVLDQQAEAIIKAVADLKAKIIEREVRLKVLRTATTAQNPDVQRLMSELSALRSELARMESTSSAAAAAASAPPGRATGIDIPVGKLPAAAVDYVRALREVKFQETMLASMLRQFEIAKLDEAKDAPSLQQVDIALPPDRKSRPARSMIVLMSTALAFLASCAWVVGRRYRRLARERDPAGTAEWSRVAQAWRWRRAG